MGESSGHEFRGNQYGAGGSGVDAKQYAPGGGSSVRGGALVFSTKEAAAAHRELIDKMVAESEHPGAVAVTTAQAGHDKTQSTADHVGGHVDARQDEVRDYHKSIYNDARDRGVAHGPAMAQANAAAHQFAKSNGITPLNQKPVVSTADRVAARGARMADKSKFLAKQRRK